MHNSPLLFDRLYQKAVTVPINVDKKWGGGNSEIFVPSQRAVRTMMSRSSVTK